MIAHFIMVHILSDGDEECNKVDFVIKLLKRINSKTCTY